MTVVPETNRQEHNRKISGTDDDIRRNHIRRSESPSGGIKSTDDNGDTRRQTPANHTPSNIPVENSDGSAILGTRLVDPDDRLLAQEQQVINDHKKSPTQSEMNDCDTGLVKPANVKTDVEVQPQNE